ncbi:hypothetical protein ACLB2K_077434 [Fragaria x ananassa]
MRPYTKFSNMVELAARKHVQFILSKAKEKDSYESVLLEHIRLNGAYWGLTTLDLFGKLDTVDVNEVVLEVLQCQHESGGFGGNIGHDPHILYTLSAVQVLALFDKIKLTSMHEWLALVKYRTSVGFKAKCEKYKEMRATRTLLHRTSKKSFARLEEELKEQSENPEVITRSVVWVHAYETKKKKGSDEVVEDHEIVKQVKQYQAKEQPSQPCSLKDDVVAKVLGPDPRGRVRGTRDAFSIARD